MHARRRRNRSRFVTLSLSLGLFLAACVPSVSGVRSSASGAAKPRAAAHALVGRDGRWLVDANGRVVGLRGVNFVQKFPPVSPSSVGFDDDDAAFLEREGFNLVRLGVVFGAVMPEPGVVDRDYVAAIAQTAHVLAQHHIYVLLDFHQDGYGPLVSGNGFPEWATLTDGLPNPDVGFPAYYVQNPALQRAFENFWANKPGPDGVPLQQHYATAVRSVASAVAGESYVLGYDLMNEPWPGSDWAPCVTGCPDLEQSRLVPFEQRMSAAIAAVDTRHLVFSEPFTLFNFGTSPTVVPASTTPRAALSFHSYALSPDAEADVVTHAVTAGVAQNAPPLATEYGATTDPATITRLASTIEDGLVSWAFWSYDENLVIDKGKPPTPDNVRQPVLDALARPYAARTNGIPASWHYDAATGDLQFSYAARPHPADDTIIALGARAYPDGYAVTVTGGRAVSPPCARTLRIKNSTHAATVTVHVTRRAASPEHC